jgi:hypothetical protein
METAASFEVRNAPSSYPTARPNRVPLELAMTEAANLIRQRFEALEPVLDEQGRRRFAATEAIALGHGGVKTSLPRFSQRDSLDFHAPQFA